MIIPQIPAVGFKGKKCEYGFYSQDNFTGTKVIKNLSRVNNPNEFKRAKTVFKYLGYPMNETEYKKYLKKLDLTELYIHDPLPEPNQDGSMSHIKWEKWFFRVENEVCKDCLRSCKQSSRVVVERCPSKVIYEGKKT